MPRYLISDTEARALRELLSNKSPSENLAYPFRQIYANHFPFRFKLLEDMGETTANKANAALYFIGTSTEEKLEEAYVVDGSSEFKAAKENDKGICISSSEYFISEMKTASEYMGTASTSYDSTTTSIVIDNLEPMNGIGTTVTTLTVENSFAWPILNNGVCYAKYNNHSSAFELLQTQCS